MKRLIIVFVIFVPSVLQASTMKSDDASKTVQSQKDNTPKDVSIEIANVHEINLDNMDVSGSGNWLEKRIWYERAQNAFNDILLSVSKVVDMRVQFLNEINLVGHRIEAFYESVNFDKGELEDKFKQILVELDFEQKLKGDLSEQERALQTTIKEEQSVIDQIGKNIKSIGEVDHRIDQTLMQAFKTIDECRDYEQKAWKTFKLIGKVLDDKKARNLYYEINTFQKNIDQKYDYLQNSLLPYLHNVLVAKIDSNIAKINDSMQKLKDKGLDIDAIMKSTQQDDVSQFEKREKEAADLAVEKALEEERVKEKEKEDKIAADKKEKQNKTWSKVVMQYIQLMQNNLMVSGSFVVEYVGTLFSSYQYPVISFMQKQWGVFRNFMHATVESLMSYIVPKTTTKKKVVSSPEESLTDVTTKDAAAVVAPVITTHAETLTTKSSDDASTKVAISTTDTASDETTSTPSDEKVASATADTAEDDSTKTAVGN